MSGLATERVGTGEPMLLVHGIGHRRQMWSPILDRLSDRFDMVAVDLPGFGESPRLGSADPPTAGRMADAVEQLMDDLNWKRAHLVGNSLGGWVSLELASRDRASSVCALMPAGLWSHKHGTNSRRMRSWFRIWTTGAALPYAPKLSRNAAIRTITQAGLFGRPWRIPADIAEGDVRNMATCDYERTKAGIHGQSFASGHLITAPTTVVFGSRDPLMRRNFSDLTNLPATTTVIRLRGVGHVPTWDDPDLIAATITDATRA